VIDLSDAQVVIRRNGNAAVKVNGVPLGAEPTPLMHGDKIEIAGHELFYAEDTKGGTTRHVMQSEVRSILEKRPGAARATIGSGGRLVSLVDGKEYIVSERGVTIGRDASSEVVVAHSEVSRKHAEIVPSERGYVIHDHSTNGVYVNGVRVMQSQLLSRSDVVRVGSEEFRFYADVMVSGPMPKASMPAATPPTSAAAAPATPAAAPAPVAPATQAPAAAAASTSPATPRVEAAPAPSPLASSEPAPVAAPAQTASSAASNAETLRLPSVPESVSKPKQAPASETRPLLAYLEIINEGVARGKRFEIRVPLAHIGRGAHNDVVVDDDSVSDTHAKLQRREDGWYLVDLGSTNGTYVGGSRLTHERRLDGAPDVRFGGVKFTFRAADVPVQAPKSTRAIASMPIDRSKLPPREPRPVAPDKPQPTEPVTSGTSAWRWVAILIAAAALAFYLLKS
jgi:pSer/pThr/pTyr-binding forkhead associated (FHA) protein